jgi:hypothetical protein
MAPIVMRFRNGGTSTVYGARVIIGRALFRSFSVTTARNYDNYGHNEDNAAIAAKIGISDVSVARHC